MVNAIDAERRRQTRRRVILRGRIVLSGGGSAFDCMVTDMSDQGVRLRTSGLQPLPERFRLGAEGVEGRERVLVS